MNDGFVTIATYPEPLEANLIRSKLLSEEIECILLDENIISVQPFYSNAIGGIKLQVHEDDAERAMQIIEDANKPALHLVYKTKKDNSNKPLENNKPACPECNSNNIYFERLSNGELVLCIIFLGLPLLFLKGRYHCYNCGHKWNKE